MLVFERSNGAAHHVPAGAVADVLTRAEVPVIVLNACQSGAIGRRLEGAIATCLLRGGATSVVAMAYRVYAAAATEFMATFYERLFAGDSVGAAVTAGRHRLVQYPLRPSPKGDIPLADWLVPVHYSRRDVYFPELRLEEAPGFAAGTQDGAHAPAIDDHDDALAPEGVFVGRDNLFYQLELAVRSNRAVLLHGAAGTGKTELAKAFGRWWIASGGVERSEWVIWHSVDPGGTPRGIDSVDAEIGSRFWRDTFAGLGISERRAKVDTLLEDKRLLLFWDNFEAVHAMPDTTGVASPFDALELTELRAFIDRISEMDSTVLIMISRTEERWLGGIARIEVDGLTSQESIQLADELLNPYRNVTIRRASHDFGELMEWLNGHPLSMRLVLPHLQDNEPTDLLNGLIGLADQAPDAIQSTSGSLAASLAYSYNHLSTATARLLVAACLFERFLDVKVLTALSDQSAVPVRLKAVTSPQWTAVLDEAAGFGLLSTLEHGVYQMPPALPGFLQAFWRRNDPGLFDTNHTEAVRCLLDAYCALSETLVAQMDTHDAATAYRFIDRQKGTLSRVLGYALDRHLWDQAHQLVRPLNTYWMTRQLYDEGRDWAARIQTAVESTAGSPPRLDSPAGSLWLTILMSQAIRERHSYQLDKSEARLLHVLDSLEHHADFPERLRRIAGVFQQLGNIAQLRGDLGDAETWARKALAASEPLNNQHLEGVAYYQLGMVAEYRSRLDEADRWYHKSLTVFEALGDRPWIGIVSHQLGTIADEQRRFEEAEDFYLLSLAIDTELGDRAGIAASYHHLGRLAKAQRQIDKAEHWYLNSLAIETELGDRLGIAGSYQSLASVAESRGDLDTAQEWHYRSLAINLDLDNRPGIADNYSQLGWVAKAQRRYDDAEMWYLKCLAMNEELGSRPEMSDTYHQLGMVAQDRRNHDEAESWYLMSLDLEAELGDRPEVSHTYFQLGRVAELRGNLEDADRLYRKSLAMGEAAGDWADVAGTCDQLGDTALIHGHLADATASYLKSLEIFDELDERPGTARVLAKLGLVADAQGHVAEAETWYMHALCIDPNDEAWPGRPAAYIRFALTAESDNCPEDALDWSVRSALLLDTLVDRAGTLEMAELTRLARRLGMAMLQESWRRVTGTEVPQAVQVLIDGDEYR